MLNFAPDFCNREIPSFRAFADVAKLTHFETRGNPENVQRSPQLFGKSSGAKRQVVVRCLYTLLNETCYASPKALSCSGTRPPRL